MYHIEHQGKIFEVRTAREAFLNIASLCLGFFPGMSISYLRLEHGQYISCQPTAFEIHKISIFLAGSENLEIFIVKDSDWRIASGKLLKFIEGLGEVITCRNTRGGARSGAGRKMGGCNKTTEQGEVMVSLPLSAKAVRQLEVLCGSTGKREKGRFLEVLIDKVFKKKIEEEKCRI